MQLLQKHPTTTMPPLNCCIKTNCRKRTARVLLEYGNKIWEKNILIAQYILEEISDLIIEDADVNNLLQRAKELLQTHPESLNRQYFILS